MRDASENHGAGRYQTLRTKVFILALSPAPSITWSLSSFFRFPSNCWTPAHAQDDRYFRDNFPPTSIHHLPAPSPAALLQGRHPSTRARIPCSKTHARTPTFFSSIDRPGNDHYSRQTTRISEKVSRQHPTQITMPPTPKARKTGVAKAPAAKKTTAGPASGVRKSTAAGKRPAGKKASNVQRTS